MSATAATASPSANFTPHAARAAPVARHVPDGDPDQLAAARRDEELVDVADDERDGGRTRTVEHADAPLAAVGPPNLADARALG
jgi:hypothetical protein